MIRKLVFCFMGILLVAGCSAPECPEPEKCPEAETIYLEDEKTVEINDLACDLMMLYVYAPLNPVALPTNGTFKTIDESLREISKYPTSEPDSMMGFLKRCTQQGWDPSEWARARYFCSLNFYQYDVLYPIDESPVELCMNTQTNRGCELIEFYDGSCQMGKDVEIEVQPTAEVNNTVSAEITKPGQYLVPEQMEPGQWSYLANEEGVTCWITTFSDLSGTYESEIDNFYSENQGFFRLNENVRMAGIKSYSDCVYSRIGD